MIISNRILSGRYKNFTSICPFNRQQIETDIADTLIVEIKNPQRIYLKRIHQIRSLLSFANLRNGMESSFESRNFHRNLTRQLLFKQLESFDELT